MSPAEPNDDIFNYEDVYNIDMFDSNWIYYHGKAYYKEKYDIVAKEDLEWLLNEMFPYDDCELHEQWDALKRYEELKERYLNETTK